MDLIRLWFPVFLFFIAPASLAYPSDTRSQSLAATNDAFPGAISQINLTGLVEAYPVYPTRCAPSQGSHQQRFNVTKILSDCSRIINEVLLPREDLLFQALAFDASTFRDRFGRRYLSRWFNGRCFIYVTTTKPGQVGYLQLFNVVLAANKVLKECIGDQGNPRGGTTHIGSVHRGFFVGVGSTNGDAANEFNISLLSDHELPGQNVYSSLSRVKANIETSAGDSDVHNLTVSVQPKGSKQRRASGPQHGSSLGTGTQSVVPEAALGISSPNLPSKNVSVQTPPSYPVECLNPYSVQIRHADGDDCRVIIDHIILRYPDPMRVQSFGYGASADIDLSLPQNEKWMFGSCAIFVRNRDRTRTDKFRMVDVAATAEQIISECIDEVKRPVGGVADIGMVQYNFFVGVGGHYIKGNANNASTLPYLSIVDLADDKAGTDGAL